MSRRMVRLMLVVLIALPLAGPACAEAAELAGPRPVWDWLAGLWEEGVSALWPWSETATEKQGAGALDPNGGTMSSSGTTTPPTTGPGEGEQGYGIDPNGRP